MSDIFDSRDLKERLEELRNMRDEIQELKDALESAQEDLREIEGSKDVLPEDIAPYQEAVDNAQNDLDSFNDCDLDESELDELEEMESSVTDWEYGATLIAESYFTDYCKELVKDIGDLPSELPYYIESNIDWDGVADDLKVDYAEFEYQGETYLVRA